MGMKSTEELEKEKRRRQDKIARHKAGVRGKSAIQRNQKKNVEQSAFDKLRMMQNGAPQKPHERWEKSTTEQNRDTRKRENHMDDLLSLPCTQRIGMQTVQLAWHEWWIQ